MRIEIYVAVDGNENIGVSAVSADDAVACVDYGDGPDCDQPVAIATFSVEMNAPKIIEGQLVVVPDAAVQTIQPELVEAV